MMQEALKNRELVSALVDGQLQGEEFAQAADWAARDVEGQLTWQAYHAVGEVLRTGDSMASGRDAAFLARLKIRLQQEPLYPPQADDIKLIAIKAMDVPAGSQISLKKDAANDAAYRWKRLAGCASVLAVVAVGFLASGIWDGQRGAPQLAQVPVEAVQPNPVASALLGDTPSVMIRDTELDALLAAHRQFGGTTAFQVSTGFLRNATFEGGGR
jgi:sigma-E factor negative regulatory protein RseA